LSAGLGAGLLGIGGGEILNAVMISIGIHPEVSTASSSFMVFFASSTSAF